MPSSMNITRIAAPANDNTECQIVGLSRHDIRVLAARHRGWVFLAIYPLAFKSEGFRMNLFKVIQGNRDILNDIVYRGSRMRRSAVEELRLWEVSKLAFDVLALVLAKPRANDGIGRIVVGVANGAVKNRMPIACLVEGR